MQPIDKKTKVVCTIGPASDRPAVLEQLIAAGMDVARLNLAHGDFSYHARVIANVRAAARALSRRVAVLADLPGPKIRIGTLADDPIELEIGQPYVLSAGNGVGGRAGAFTSFVELATAVRPGSTVFLNDGLVQLEVARIDARDVHCVVRVGGTLRSNKGMNLPDADLGVRAFTARDRECLDFALDHDVDAVSQSFVETAADIRAVRAAAAARGKHLFLVAKIERVQALAHIDKIGRAHV